MAGIITLSEAAEESKSKPLEVIKAEKYASFLNNLEKWVEATVLQDNINDEEVIRRVKESYRRSLQANVEFYDLMSKTMQAKGERESLKRYIRMAKVYRVLLE